MSYELELCLPKSLCSSPAPWGLCTRPYKQGLCKQAQSHRKEVTMQEGRPETHCKRLLAGRDTQGERAMLAAEPYAHKPRSAQGWGPHQKQEAPPTDSPLEPPEGRAPPHLTSDFQPPQL